MEIDIELVQEVLDSEHDADQIQQATGISSELVEKYRTGDVLDITLKDAIALAKYGKQTRDSTNTLGQLVGVFNQDGRISVKSPYNKGFVKDARGIGAKWNPSDKVWVFDEAQKEEVNRLLKIHYGYTDEREGAKSDEKVIIKFKASDFQVGEEIKFGSLLIAKRWRRDSPVNIDSNAYVIKGYFQDSGGSAGHPNVGNVDGIVIKLDIPKSVLDLFIEKKMVDEDKFEIIK